MTGLVAFLAIYPLPGLAIAVSLWLDGRPDDAEADPWALTPDQQDELDARAARRRAEFAAIPDTPPF